MFGLLLVVALLGLAPGVARACPCGAFRSPPLEVDDYDVVFEGRPLRIDGGEPIPGTDGDPDVPVGIWTFEVLRSWKGELEPWVELRTTLGAVGCGANFWGSEDRWVIYANQGPDGEFWTYRCSPSESVDVDGHIAALVDELGPGRRPVAWVAPTRPSLPSPEGESPPVLEPTTRGCSTSPGGGAPLVLLLCLGCGAAWRRRGAARVVLVLGVASASCVAHGDRPASPNIERSAVAEQPEPSCPPLPDGPALVRTERGGKWGFADLAGTLVVAPRYDAIEEFDGPLARVRIGRGWGAIDRSGRERIAARWQALGPPSHGLVRAKAGYNHVEILDLCGRTVLPGPFLAVDYIGEQVLIAEREHEGVREWAALDHRGEIVIPWSGAPLAREPFAIRQTPIEGVVWATPTFRRLFDLDGRHLFDWRGLSVEFIGAGEWVIAYDASNRVCLLDRRGAERVACGQYRGFRATAEVNRVWAKTAGGSVLLDLSGDEPVVVDDTD